MKRTYIVENTKYTVTPCTAIAGCDLRAGAIQNALLVESAGASGEKFRYVVFGYEMPETAEDFAYMCEDSAAWESDYEVLKTVVR